MNPKNYILLSTKEILDDFNPFEIARKKRDGIRGYGEREVSHI